MGLWLYLYPKLDRMNNVFVTVVSHQISFKIVLETPSRPIKINDSNVPKLFGMIGFFFFDIGNLKKRASLTTANLSSMLLHLMLRGKSRSLQNLQPLPNQEVFMKETVLDVLMYLFECFVDSEDTSEPDKNELREELERAGFRHREIDRALEWLDGLKAPKITTDSVTAHFPTLRVFDRSEQERLNTSCRGYLLHLEQLGILSPVQRELVIDRLLALDSSDIDIEHIKWVVMMVLFSQPSQQQEYERMEDLVFAEDPDWLH